MDPGAIAQLILSLLGTAAGPLIAGAPGPMENTYRQQIRSDLQNLAAGGGGMGQGKLQELQGQALGQIGANLQQQQAQLMRGAGSTQLSGAQLAALNHLQAMGSQAQRGAMSDLRAQDLATAQAQREGLQARMQAMIGSGLARKQMASQQDYSGLDRLGQQLGGSGRSNVTADTAALNAKDAARTVPLPAGGYYGGSTSGG